MLMLRFNLNNINLNLPMTLFYIWTPLQPKTFMMKIWFNSYSYSTQIMMVIYWMLTYIFFGFNYWLLRTKLFIQSTLCCFINTEETMLVTKIVYHTLLCSSQPRPMWNWLMKHGTCPGNWDYFMLFFKIPHYICSGTTIIFSRSPFQHHFIGWPQTLFWFSKGYVRTSWTLRFSWTSGFFLEINLPDSEQFRISSNINLLKSSLK